MSLIHFELPTCSYCGSRYLGDCGCQKNNFPVKLQSTPYGPNELTLKEFLDELEKTGRLRRI